MRMTGGLLIAVASASVGTMPVPAAIVGRTPVAEAITDARIAALPAAERPAWTAYLARSRALQAADRAALAAERAGRPVPPPPAPGPSGGRGMALDRPDAWYAGPAAQQVADNIVSFQTPAGGWGKNVDRTGPSRLPGQFYVPVEHLPAMAKGDIQSRDADWRYVGTIDNNATTAELRFLARVQAQRPGAAGDRYRAALDRGLRYLLAAQHPSGGWPQIFPLEGGYHDALTYNDDAFADVVELLAAAGARRGDYAALPAPLAAEARAAVARAIALVLATQVTVDGRPTVWGQQHDALTLKPIPARAFEPASLASNESARLLILLMRIPEPTDRIRTAVAAGVAWLQAHALRDVAWVAGSPGEGKRLVPRPGAGPVWARFYALDTGRPIFGDRDRSVHDRVEEISAERRDGYSWYGSGPGRAIEAYARWPGRTG